MARLLADECVDARIVTFLRRCGHDIVTVHALGLGNRGVDDADVMAAAVADTRAALSPNRRHYIRLHRRDPRHYGVVVYTDEAESDYLQVATRLEAAIRAHEPLDGKCLKVCKPPQGTQVEP